MCALQEDTGELTPSEKEEKNKPAKLYGRLNLLWYALAAAAVVGIDQLTKWLAVTMLKPVGDYPLWKGVLHLTYVENTGAAFGMLSDKRWVFMIASSVAVIGISVFICIYSRRLHPLAGISLAMIVGGGVGNMIDRLINGYVVDFINFELIDFAVFNGADSFICVGAGLMIIYVMVTEIRDGKKKA